ncbi:MAG: hypothetical protein ACPGVJ_04870, partial [Mangrovicoccus sp.]
MVTFAFHGVVTDQADPLAEIKADDRFRGQLTIDLNAARQPHDHPTLEWIYPDTITQWSMDFSNGISLEGNLGSMALGDNHVTQVGWGYDRLITSMDARGALLPSGRRVDFAQFSFLA